MTTTLEGAHAPPLSDNASRALTSLLELIQMESPGTRASVLLLDGDHLRHGAAPSLPATYNAAIDGLKIGPHVGSCGSAAYRRERVVVNDIENDPLWRDFKDLAMGFGLRACWSQPIFSSTGTVLGTFAIYFDQPTAPKGEDLHRIELCADIVRALIE